MQTICLHNKGGKVPTHRDLVHKADGEGNCWNCTFDPVENKNCRKFYPVDINTFADFLDAQAINMKGVWADEA